MTTIPVLRGTTRADLLALPSFMFEFHPAESVVVLGMRGNVVVFSARLDVDWFRSHFDQVSDQMINAASQVGGLEVILLGYASDPDLAWASVTELCDLFGSDQVVEALVTDGAQYWSLTDDEGPLPYDFETSSVAARAVYEGVIIHASREAAVAPVSVWEPPAQPAVDEALGRIAALDEGDAMELLEQLAEAQPPVEGDGAVLLACLLAHEERCAALLTRMSTLTAPRIWHNLAAARRVAPHFAEATVVALLGMASWLAGRGAQSTACLEQVSHLDPRHPVGQVLGSIHQHGIPPQRWDEE